jgi:ketoreductase RED2
MTTAVDLRSRVVIATGSSSGIGHAVARRVAACGAGVVVNLARSVDAGERLADELPNAIYVGGDIAAPDWCVVCVCVCVRWLEGGLST